MKGNECETEALQLQLFESSTWSSRSDVANSPLLSERATSSSEPSTSTTIGAIASASNPHARDSYTRDGVGAVVTSSSDAKPTADSAQQPMLPTFTGRNTADKMLTVPRPKTRAECRAEARPCPWVGCRHHLLLEVAKAKPREGRAARPPSLRLNMASRDRTSLGRRSGLRSSAAALVVRQWIDEAVEALQRMRYTCALDVAEDYPDGLSDHGIAQLLGIHEQLVDAEVRHAVISMRRLGLKRLRGQGHDFDLEDEEDVKR